MTPTHLSMSHEGKEILRKIAEGSDGVTAGPWGTINNGNEYWLMHETGCMQTGYECAFNREDARHLSRCSPDAIRAIAAYTAALEAELSTARRTALLEAAEWHDDSAELHKACEHEDNHHVMMAKAHRMFAAAFRKKAEKV